MSGTTTTRGMANATERPPAGPAASLVAGGVLATAGAAVFSAYALVADATRFLADVVRVEAFAGIDVLWLTAGWLIAAAVERRGRNWFRTLTAFLVVLASIWFIYLRRGVQQGVAMFPPASGYWPLVAAGFVAALVWARVYPRWIAGSAPAQWIRRRALALACAAGVALAAPSALLPVAQNWNVSGWMDSHGYDVYAHNIATGKAVAGNSSYMPVYQYGMAMVDLVFGHYFFAQQLVNVVLALIGILCICLAAWNLFRRPVAVLLVALWMAFTPALFSSIFFTQIESWYIPIVCVCVFCWSCYWRSLSTPAIVVTAIAAGVAINTRNQGAFFFLLLCATPLVAGGVPLRTRLVQTVTALVILGCSLVPWTLRNYAVEGRLSPSASRNAYYIALLNDPRIGFYGLRYWEGWSSIASDYERRYPDPAEREHAMMMAGLRTPFVHWDWFRRAVVWRSLAFYGLAPPGVFAPSGPVKTDWPAEWRGYVFWRTAALVFVSLSILGLATRPNRTTGFLAAAILSNLAAVALTGGGEERVSYPVLPLHMLLALCAVFPVLPPATGWRLSWPSGVSRRGVAGGAIVAGAVALLCYVYVGRPNLYAPQLERAVLVDGAVAIDETLPSLEQVDDADDASLAGWQDRPVRLRFIVTNYMLPPKFAGPVGWMPAMTTDPGGETYYYGYERMNRAGTPPAVRVVGITLFGATVSEPLREGDEVEAEGRIVLVRRTTVATFWIQIVRARKLPTRPSEIPAFY
jgi:hypothetical protein